MNINNLKSVIIIAILAISFSACNNSKNTTTEPTQVPDGHTAQNALDWSGTYSGNLPCADCEAIQTELTINEDLTYSLVTQYLGKGNDLADTIKGSFAWEGNNIKLDGIPAKEGSSMFKIEENQVRYLDLEGKPVEGDLAQFYILSKNGNPNVEDKKWKIVEVNGKAVKGTDENHYIIFHSKEGRLEAKANCNVMLRYYKIKNQLQVIIDQGITTLMACPDNLEQEFVEVLNVADNISVDENSLSLNKARMAPLAKFVLVEN